LTYTTTIYSRDTHTRKRKQGKTDGEIKSIAKYLVEIERNMGQHPEAASIDLTPFGTRKENHQLCFFSCNQYKNHYNAITLVSIIIS
jgi:hypothetical protein